jgi:hypothetical protein
MSFTQLKWLVTLILGVLTLTLAVPAQARIIPAAETTPVAATGPGFQTPRGPKKLRPALRSRTDTAIVVMAVIFGVVAVALWAGLLVFGILWILKYTADPTSANTLYLGLGITFLVLWLVATLRFAVRAISGGRRRSSKPSVPTPEEK